MKSELKSPKIKLNYTIITIITILLMFFLLADSTLLIKELKIAFPVYIIVLISLLFFLGYLYKYGLPKSKIKYLFILYFIYFLYLGIYSYQTSDINGLKYSIRILVYITIIFLVSLSIFDRKKILITVGLFSFLPLTLFLMWTPTGQFFEYAGIFRNPNTLGIIVYLMLFFHVLVLFLYKSLISKTVLYLFILMDLILLYVSTSRAVWIAMILGIVIYSFWKVITINKLIYRLTFIFIMIGVFLFSYVYPKLSTMKMGWEIDAFFIKLTGKRFFSGREKLWAYIINLAEDKPFIGYGVSKSLPDFMTTGFSAHNTYLSILLQTGMIGLVLYVLLLFLIWEMLYPRSNNIHYEGRVLSLFPAFLGSLLAYQIFERSLVQGLYSVSIIEWLILAIGISLNTKITIKTKRPAVVCQDKIKE